RTRSRCACSRATSPTATRSAWTPRKLRFASRGSGRPPSRSSVLVVAATERELALLDALDTFCCGIGPVEAALQTARALEERLRACELAGVPAVELRAISNSPAEADRTRWRFDDAFAALAAALQRLDVL